jgi:hypothetical protein
MGSILIVGSNRDGILVIASSAAGAQLGLLGFRNKRLCFGKQFHNTLGAFWTLTICCDHMSSPVVDILAPL